MEHNLHIDPLLEKHTLTPYLINVYSGKLPTYPSPNLTLTLSYRFGQNVRFGEGWVASFLETFIDPPSDQRF